MLAPVLISMSWGRAPTATTVRAWDCDLVVLVQRGRLALTMIHWDVRGLRKDHPIGAEPVAETRYAQESVEVRRELEPASTWNGPNSAYGRAYPPTAQTEGGANCLPGKSTNMSWIIPDGPGNGTWNGDKKDAVVPHSAPDLKESGDGLLNMLKHVLCQGSVEGAGANGKCRDIGNNIETRSRFCG